MFGAICGDTIGSAYEFKNTKDYNFTLFLGDSNFTDDSVMSAAVALWLLNDKEHTPGRLEKYVVKIVDVCPCHLRGYGVMSYM